MRRTWCAIGGWVLSLLGTGWAWGANAVPTPIDRPYAGTLELHVDATNIRQRIFHVREHIPVRQGPLTLLYPQWQLGAHAPQAEALVQLAGLTLTSNGRHIEWHRDPLDVWAFHMDVPAGAQWLDAEFDFLSATEADQGSVLVTEEMLAVHWELLLLYPAGHFAHGIHFKPTVRFPDGWQTAGALDVDARNGSEVQFRPIDLEQLIDSPIYAGRHMKRVELDPGSKVPMYLDLFADNVAELEGTPKQIDAHRALFQQAHKLFGSHHYDHYDFLVAISDTFGFSGLEHQQSGENGVRGNYFADWDHQQSWRSSLISHEYTHSWDGKFLRPAGQLIPNFNEPMDDTLLWVYEGGTDYWGRVLGARSGLVEESQMRDAFAATAALYDHRVGREWRALIDTSYQPVITDRGPQGWVSWQRTEDYYAEGELIWLDADTKIRELSGGKKSLDNFAQAFFGVRDGEHVPPQPYTFDTVIRALNSVQPYDWASFLHQRLEGHGPGAPLDGLKRAGWRLVYTDTPSAFSKDEDAYVGVEDFHYSLGFLIKDNGRLVDVSWDGLAFKAGLTKGYVLLAVNGDAYKPEVLKSAVTAAKGSPQPIELIFRKDDRFTTVRLDYHDGLKYPHLERVEGMPDMLADIFKAR